MRPCACQPVPVRCSSSLTSAHKALTSTDHFEAAVRSSPVASADDKDGTEGHLLLCSTLLTDNYSRDFGAGQPKPHRHRRGPTRARACPFFGLSDRLTGRPILDREVTR